MNKILPFLQECISNLKANIVMSSITIISSLLISKMIFLPLMRYKKKNLQYSQKKLNFLLNLIKKSETTNLNNLIFVPYLTKILKIIREEEDIDDNNEANNIVTKLKKTKKIINKLTKEFIKQEEKVHNSEFKSQKDKIFYILLNNMHFMNSNNKSKIMNDNISSKFEEVENS